MDVIRELKVLAAKLEARGYKQQANKTQEIVQQLLECSDIAPGGASAPFINPMDRKEQVELIEHTIENKKEMDKRISPAPNVKDPNALKHNLSEGRVKLRLTRLATKLDKESPEYANKLRTAAADLQKTAELEDVESVIMSGDRVKIKAAVKDNDDFRVPVGAEGVVTGCSRIYPNGRQDVNVRTDQGQSVSISSRFLEKL